MVFEAKNGRKNGTKNWPKLSLKGLKIAIFRILEISENFRAHFFYPVLTLKTVIFSKIASFSTACLANN